jgi:CRP-like cAMP-binding protein
MVYLFAELSDESIVAVLRHSVIRNIEKGKQILSVRDRTHDVFFVLHGRVQVKTCSSDGREFIYSEINAGGMFGEFSAIDGLPRSASVVAIEETTVARMRSADFLDLLRSDVDLTLTLLRYLTSKARELSDRVLELISLSARERLRFEISRLASKGAGQGPRVVIRPVPTHYELAVKIGSQREVVTRELNRLASLGYLLVDRHQIVVLDIGRFESDLIGNRDE